MKYQKNERTRPLHYSGVPQTPIVDSIEPTADGDGDIFVNVVIPSVDGFDIPAETVTFTVVATLQPDGNMTTVMFTVNSYSYGDVAMVMVSGLMVGRNYVFTVSASNVFGDSLMEVVGETINVQWKAYPTSRVYMYTIPYIN